MPDGQKEKQEGSKEDSRCVVVFERATTAHLCVYRRHSLNLEVEKSFVTLHPLDLSRKFLHNKYKGKTTVSLPFLCPKYIYSLQRILCRIIYQYMCLPQVCAVSSWQEDAPKQWADRTDRFAVGHYSAWAATGRRVNRKYVSSFISSYVHFNFNKMCYGVSLDKEN